MSTLLCLPCWLDELERSRSLEPIPDPRVVMAAILIADGRSLCVAHALAWAHAAGVAE